MDPLSALGVASNILAIVDFVWTLLGDAKAIHNSPSGTSDEAAFTEDIVRDIARLSSNLPVTLQKMDDLRFSLSKSKEITAEILSALQSIKQRGRRSKWNSFGIALKSVWGDNKLKNLLHKLQTLQDQVFKYIQVATMCVAKSPHSQAVKN